MPERLTFNEAAGKYFPTLEQYVPIVSRVHGKTHPEFLKVQQLFNQIIEEIKAAGTAKPLLREEFIKLRKITNNYAVPSDVCESYETVYKLLELVDRAYQTK